MMRFSVVYIGRDDVRIERFAWYWWPVKALLRVVHVVSGCRACWWSPVHRLEMKFLNSHGKHFFDIPVGPDMRVRLAESYGIPLRDDWDDDD